MISCDTVIIRADPVGLFQVFELGLPRVNAHAIDSMLHAAGQCIELHPDKPIHEIPAQPVCSGHELIERLQQIRPFTPSPTSLARQLRPGVRDAQRDHVVVQPPPRVAATAA